MISVRSMSNLLGKETDPKRYLSTCATTNCLFWSPAQRCHTPWTCLFLQSVDCLVTYPVGLLTLPLVHFYGLFRYLVSFLYLMDISRQLPSKLSCWTVTDLVAWEVAG